MWNIAWPQPKECEIPVANTSLTPTEISNVTQALDSGWISSSGEWNHRAEAALSKLIDVESLLVSNGSVAITLALRALGIKHGDEVIVPSLTFAATASAVANIGAIPVFCDVDESNWNMSEEHLHSLITKNTKAIIAVHLYGFPAPMNEIINFARRQNLVVIEDCAEAPLARIDGLNVGSFGDVATFSFFANKLISCGEGGAVASKNPKILDRMKLLRGQGMDAAKRYFFVEPGYNFRLSNIQAAILTSQFENARKIESNWNLQHAQYRQAFEREKVSLTEQHLKSNEVNSPWLYTVRINRLLFSKKIELASHLANFGVETRPIFYPLHEMPAFWAPSTKIVNAIRISVDGISLPTGPHMNKSRIEFIAQLISEFLGKK